MTRQQSRPVVSGPAEEKAPGDGLSAAIVDQPADCVAEQLRRRREAALRLPPLPSGHRDPLDELAAQR